VTVDSGEPRVVASDGKFSLNVPTGWHQARIQDVAANCAVSGAATRQIEVKPGARVAVTFEVACRAMEPAGRGHEIAFTRGDDLFGVAELIIANDDGTALRHVPPITTVPGADDVFPSWAPDGQRLAMADGLAEFNSALIYTRAPDGSDGVRVTSPATRFSQQAVWSPDGSKLTTLVWQFDDQGLPIAIDLASINLDGSNPQYLTLFVDSARVTSDRLSWNPEGSRLALSIGGLPGPGDLYTVGGDGADLRQLTETPDNETEPAWSPDGTRIAFASQAPDEAASQIWVMSSDGSDRVQLTTLEGSSPTWSPDGMRLAFVSRRDGNLEIYVMAADGSGQSRITNDPAPDYDPAWRP
jgi:TolB protein